jgi:hypothetical protein
MKWSLLLILPVFISCTGKHTLSEKEVLALVQEAYVYATPLIYTDVTRVSSPVPDNYLHHSNNFPDHTFRQVVAPNNDTNYSTAFLELNDEPFVLEIPDTKGRYYVFPFLDAWTNNFLLPGKRATGTGEQKYFITGPGWTGEVPDGLIHVPSPTNLVWLIGRIQVNSPKDQTQFVTPLQEKFKLQSLSAWQGIPQNTPDVAHKLYGNYLPENITGKSVVEIVRNIPLEDFFNYFNALLADNPPAVADSSLISRIAQIGIGAGEHFSLAGFNKGTQEVLSHVVADTYAAFDNAGHSAADFGTVADPTARLGVYGTAYNLRALVAYRGLGALPPEEAVYYNYYTDRDGKPLHGSHSYRIHFERNQLPPAEAFWSYTAYDSDRYLIENPIRRYAIGDRDKLKYNSDGSLDLYLSHTSPGAVKESNWLPVSADDFNIVARIYIPTPEFLQDRSRWTDPLPEKIN